MCADVLGMLLRVQADQRPLSTIIIEVLKSHGNASTAGSLHTGVHSNVQPGHDGSVDIIMVSNSLAETDSHGQPLGCNVGDAEKPAKRPKKAASSGSSAQPVSGIVEGDDGQPGASFSADRAGKSSGRKLGRDHESPDGELAALREDRGAAWKVLQRLRAVAEGEAEALDASCNKDSHVDGINGILRVIDCLPGVHPFRIFTSIHSRPPAQVCDCLCAIWC